MDVQPCPPPSSPRQRIMTTLLADPSLAIKIDLPADPLFFAGVMYMYLSTSLDVRMGLFPTRVSAFLPCRDDDFYYNLIADQILSGTTQFVKVNDIP